VVKTSQQVALFFNFRKSPKISLSGAADKFRRSFVFADEKAFFIQIRRWRKRNEVLYG